VTLSDGSRHKGKGRDEVTAGARLIKETPGGGGMGDVTRRDPERVRQDLEAGLISAEAARQVYGLVVEDGSDEDTQSADR
jgi:N-methylhydantoinase B